MKASAFLLTAAAGLLAGPLASGNALAASPKLHGTFGGVGSVACLNSSNGFNADFTPASGSTVSTSTHDTVAVFTFKPNGTGTIDSNTNVSLSDGGASSSHESNVPFTYTTTKGGEATITVASGAFMGTFDTGPRATQTFTIDPWTVDAFPAQGDKGVGIATKAPLVETITFQDSSSIQRICHRQITMLPINPSDLKNQGGGD